MKLSELLRPECIRVRSTADDKALALCEIASLAKQCAALDNVTEDAILEAFQEREILGSTAFGHEIAIPHCRMRDVKDFVVGMMTLPEGADFEAEDRRKVRLIVFIIAPRQQSDLHIRLLSVISRALQDEAAVERMIAAKDPAHLQRLFLAAAGEDISEQIHLRRNMIHIFVQDNNVFRDILETLCGVETISLSVQDAARCRTYLPLYAGLVEEADNTCKIITAIVQRRLSNEVIRRVETITGSLLECMGVMVTVQELDYSAGSLEV